MVKESALSDLRRFDHLINYVYLSALEDEELDLSMLESVALLYMPVTLHHAFLEGTRVLQLVTRASWIDGIDTALASAGTLRGFDARRPYSFTRLGAVAATAAVGAGKVLNACRCELWALPPKPATTTAPQPAISSASSSGRPQAS